MRNLMLQFFELMSLYTTVNDSNPGDPTYQTFADIKGKYSVFAES